MTTILHRALLSRRPALAAVLASLLLLSCKDGAAGKAPANGAPPKPPAVGTPVDFRLPSVDGRALGPRSFPGQVVVVDFWATWCLPCRLQAQILEPVYRDLKGRGVQFLAVNVGETPDDVRKFLKATPFAQRHNMTFEQLMAGVEKAVRSYWGKRGEQVVQDNLTCIRRGYQEAFEVPREVLFDTALDDAAAAAALPVVSG